MQSAQFLGEVGNCLFILITGYFCAQKTSPNLKSLNYLLFDVHFYSIILFLSVVLAGASAFSIGGLVKSICPLIFTQYWFILPYIVVFLISPWLNHIIDTLTSKQLFCYFAILLLIECLLPVINAKTISSNVGLFILFYSTGAILSKKEVLLDLVKRYNLVLILVSGAMCVFLNYLQILGVSPFQADSAIAMRFSPLPILFSVGLLSIFVSKTYYSQLINKIAKSVFAVYLISENANVWPWLWKTKLFSLANVSSPYIIIPKMLGNCLLVMAICITIDLVEKKFLEQSCRSPFINR